MRRKKTEIIHFCLCVSVDLVFFYFARLPHEVAWHFGAQRTREPERKRSNDEHKNDFTTNITFTFFFLPPAHFRRGLHSSQHMYIYY